MNNMPRVPAQPFECSAQDALRLPSHPPIFRSVGTLPEPGLACSFQQRLAARLMTSDDPEYAVVASSIVRFSARRFESSAAGVRLAILELVDVVARLKALDDRVPHLTDAVDGRGHEYRSRLSPGSVVAPVTALQDGYGLYPPRSAEPAVEAMARAVDAAVERLCYRDLREDSRVQQVLRGALASEVRRFGIQPRNRAEGAVFVERLVNYVNSWML